MADEERLQPGAFLASIAGISAFVGFGTTLAAAKKADPKYFNRGVHGSVELADTGALLALRALGWGTLYAICGTTCFCYGIWKLSGAKNVSIQIRFSNPKLIIDGPLRGLINLRKVLLLPHSSLDISLKNLQLGATSQVPYICFPILQNTAMNRFGDSGSPCLTSRLVICGAILLNRTLLKEFRVKMGNFLPVIPKNNPPQSRTEFSGMNDLMKYLSEEYGSKKMQDVTEK